MKTIDKVELRKKAQNQRNLLSRADLLQKGSIIAERLLKLDEFIKAKTIMCYLSFGSEVSTWEISRHCLDSGKTLAIPKIEKLSGKEKRMIACVIKDLENGLQPGSFGIMEPAAEFTVPLPIAEIDLIIVPGLLFDRRGYRLGYGGGYYDRFLSDKGNNCRSVGVCYESQFVQKLPIKEYDVPVEIVITESRVYRI